MTVTWCLSWRHSAYSTGVTASTCQQSGVRISWCYVKMYPLPLQRSLRKARTFISMKHTLTSLWMFPQLSLSWVLPRTLLCRCAVWLITSLVRVCPSKLWKPLLLNLSSWFAFARCFAYCSLLQKLLVRDGYLTRCLTLRTQLCLYPSMLMFTTALGSSHVHSATQQCHQASAHACCVCRPPRSSRVHRQVHGRWSARPHWLRRSA